MSELPYINVVGYKLERTVIMNNSQKKAWFEMLISLAGLVFSGISYYFFNRAGEPPYAIPWIYFIPLINLPIVLCLIGYVLTSAKFKAKNFDERETILSLKSQLHGFLAIFVFLTFIAMVFLVRNIAATVPIRILLLMIVSSFFFSVTVTSISFLLMYQSRIERSQS